MHNMGKVMNELMARRGLKVDATWEQTRTRLALQAVAQLSRKDLRPTTLRKWHEIGFATGAGALILQKMGIRPPKQVAA